MPISSFLQKERPRTAAFSPAYTPPRCVPTPMLVESTDGAKIPFMFYQLMLYNKTSGLCTHCSDLPQDRMEPLID